MSVLCDRFRWRFIARQADTHIRADALVQTPKNRYVLRYTNTNWNLGNMSHTHIHTHTSIKDEWMADEHRNTMCEQTLREETGFGQTNAKLTQRTA